MPTEENKRARLLFKRSTVAGSRPTPSDLELGEFAVNLVDKKIFTKDMHTGKIVTVNEAAYIKIENQDLPYTTLEEAFIALNKCSEAIRRPAIVYPYSGAVDVKKETKLEGDTYLNKFGIDRSHRQFQVDIEGGDFSNPILDIEVNSDVFYTSDSFELPNKDSLIFRIRDVAVNGDYSQWSCVSRFTPSRTEIVRPILEVEDAPNNVNSDPLLTTTGFNVSGGSDIHISTDWRISRGTTVVWENLGDAFDKTSVRVPSGILAPNESYVFQVRFNGNDYSSAWAMVSANTRLSFVATPIIVSPKSEADNFVGKLVADIPYQPDMVRWELATDSTFTNIVASYEGMSYFHEWTPDYGNYGYEKNTLYARVKHRVEGYWSYWSSIVVFTTVNTTIFNPIISVNSGLTKVGKSPVISTVEMRYEGGNVTHSATDWRIMQGETEIWKESNSSLLTSISVPSGVLAESSTYTIEVRHIGSNGLASEWSSLVVSTASTFVPNPIEVGGSLLADEEYNITANIIADTSGISQVEWQAAPTNGFFSPFDSSTSNTNFTDWTPSIDEVGLAGKNVFVRVRYKVDGFWSKYYEISFRVKDINPITPIISVEGIETGSIVATIPYMELSNINVTDDTLSTEWEIITNNTIVWALESSTELEEIEATPSYVFAANTQYTIRARNQSLNYGYSEWSEFTFTTPAEFTAV